MSTGRQQSHVIDVLPARNIDITARGRLTNRSDLRCSSGGSVPREPELAQTLNSRSRSLHGGDSVSAAGRLSRLGGGWPAALPAHGSGPPPATRQAPRSPETDGWPHLA